MATIDKDLLLDKIDRLLKLHNYAREDWFANVIHNTVWDAPEIEIDGDLISRADAIEVVRKIVPVETDIDSTLLDKAEVIVELSALPSAEAVDANDVTIHYKPYPSAETEPTVIRSRTFMPTKDFKEWAKRIREVNPNAVVIPCDAEVVSAEAVQGWIPCSERLPKINQRVLLATNEGRVFVGYREKPDLVWQVTEQLPKIDEALPLCDQISDEVLGTDTYGNNRHVYLTNCGYLKPTFCTVEEGMSVDIVAWMPLPEPYEEVER